MRGGGGEAEEPSEGMIDLRSSGVEEGPYGHPIHLVNTLCITCSVTDSDVHLVIVHPRAVVMPLADEHVKDWEVEVGSPLHLRSDERGG